MGTHTYFHSCLSYNLYSNFFEILNPTHIYKKLLFFEKKTLQKTTDLKKIIYVRKRLFTRLRKSKIKLFLQSQSISKQTFQSFTALRFKKKSPSKYASKDPLLYL